MMNGEKKLIPPLLNIEIVNIEIKDNKQILQISIDPLQKEYLDIEKWETELYIDLPINIENGIFESIKSAGTKFKILEIISPRYIAIREAGFLFTDLLDTLEYQCKSKDWLFNGKIITDIENKMMDIWLGTEGRNYINSIIGSNSNCNYITNEDIDKTRTLHAMKRYTDYMHIDNLELMKPHDIIGLAICKAITYGSHQYLTKGFFHKNLIKEYLNKYTCAERAVRMLENATDAGIFDLENTILFNTFDQLDRFELNDHPSWKDFTMFGGPNSGMMGKILKKIDPDGSNKLLRSNPLFREARSLNRGKAAHSFSVYAKQALPLEKKQNIRVKSIDRPKNSIPLETCLLFACADIPTELETYCSHDDSIAVDGLPLTAMIKEKYQYFSREPFDIKVETGDYVCNDIVFNEIKSPRNKCKIISITQDVETVKDFPCFEINIEYEYPYDIHIGDKIASIQGKKGVISYISNEKFSADFKSLGLGLNFAISIFSKDILNDLAKKEGLLNLLAIFNKNYTKYKDIPAEETDSYYDSLIGKPYLCKNNKKTDKQVRAYPIQMMRLSQLAKNIIGYSKKSKNELNAMGQSITSKGNRRYIISSDELMAMPLLVEDREKSIKRFHKCNPHFKNLVQALYMIVDQDLGINCTYSRHLEEID